MGRAKRNEQTSSRNGHFLGDLSTKNGEKKKNSSTTGGRSGWEVWVDCSLSQGPKKEKAKQEENDQTIK